MTHDGSSPAESADADIATAATLPDASEGARVQKRSANDGAAAPARLSPKDAATLSMPEGGAPKPELGMALVGDEPASLPVRPTSLPLALQERFESLTFLGEGGMGVVYRARDKSLGRDVALKFLFGGGAETTERLLREARSQARLEHENACKVYEVGAAEGHRYIVMQYIDGEPLDKAAKRMTLEEKARVVRQITAALHEAHRLGLVHRDIKPSNILVEQGEDGAWKPYLMDFGLARDVGERGQTVTGTIAGTPAFMAPEQAAGEVRALDRRTDVYSLGATLYDVVCGRPPFVDDNIFRLLQRVAREDPAPLRAALPGVPEDIDAIVMKCLEKEPGRRYESARALGEELQRFLDGEPVQARRASVFYVALKKVRKHKAKMAIAGAALLAALALVVAWARERQLASARATLSRELGEDVKEMELFLRNAYALPLHDIERERDVVRARLRGVEERMRAAGPAGEGPGHYAIGRGHLALREPERALGHLRAATAAGYTSPELDYALGLALGELYKKALEAARRIENLEQKKARVAAIEAEYKEPALRHLRAALGARLEVPEHVEGLIALSEGRHLEAAAKAEEAFRKAPWLPDAKKLEGDAYFAEGSRFRADAAFDFDRMMLHFNRADAAYRSAAEMARSDPDVHAAACELWIQVVNASQASPGSLRSSFDRAIQACERGAAASSRSPASRIKMALAYQTFGYQLTWHIAEPIPGSGEPDTIIEEALRRAEEAVRVSPEDPMASYLLAATWRTQVSLFINRGVDPGAPIERAIAAYKEVLRLDPTFLWAHSALCSTYTAKARSEHEQGLDPSASIRAAVERCDRAIELDPTFIYPAFNKGRAHVVMAKHLIDTGGSPEADLRAALDASAVAKTSRPDAPDIPSFALWTYILGATYESDAGRDPSASLARAEESMRELDRLAPSSSLSGEARGMLALAKAQHLVRLERDPGAALQEARAASQRILDETPWDIDYRVQRARIEVLAARWALREGAPPPAELDAALASLSAMLDQERAPPQLYQTLAEIHELRAAHLLARTPPRDGAGEEITKGLGMAEKALARNPRMAAAHAVKGGLYLLEARAARDPAGALAAARRAKESLAAALRENPRITRDRALLIEAVDRLLASDGGAAR